MHITGLDDMFFTNQFVQGLKEEVRYAVQAQMPKKLEKALLLAPIQEDINGRTKHRPAKTYNPSRFSGSVQREGKQSTQSNELWKARQARDYRKANNLCLYCAAPFSPAHLDVCEKRLKPQIHSLSVEELNQQELNDDILLQLEQEDAIAQDLLHLSVNAVSSLANEDTIRLRALVRNQVMLTLVDSGSSHSFASAAFVQKLGLKTVPAPPAQVKVGGSLLLSNTLVPGLEWWIQGHTFKTDMRVIDLGIYDAILGFDWFAPQKSYGLPLAT